MGRRLQPARGLRGVQCRMLGWGCCGQEDALKWRGASRLFRVRPWFTPKNGLGQGGYWNGLVSTGRFTLYPADDDVTRTFGDVNEESLQTALAWLNGDATRSSNLSKKLLNKRPQIAPFGASWPLNEPIPLNPDGSIRSF